MAQLVSILLLNALVILSAGPQPPLVLCRSPEGPFKSPAEGTNDRRKPQSGLGQSKCAIPGSGRPRGAAPTLTQVRSHPSARNLSGKLQEVIAVCSLGFLLSPNIPD